MGMTDRERADSLREEAVWLLRNKSPRSTWIERHILLDQARKEMEGLPQPLVQGRGFRWVLNRASLPIDDRDFLLGRYIDKELTEEEEAVYQDIFQNRHPVRNPILAFNGGHITFDWEGLIAVGIPGYIQKTNN